MKSHPKSPKIYFSEEIFSQRTLLRSFWIALALYVALIAFSLKDLAFESVLALVLISFASLLPSWIWCKSLVRGMPIFPLFALTGLWTYASPLIFKHPIVMLYSPANHLHAAVTIALLFLTGTLVWLGIIKSRHIRPQNCLMFDPSTALPLFFLTILAATLFKMSEAANWIHISGAALSILRAAIFGVDSLAIFYVSYLLGKRELSTSYTYIYFILIPALLITQTVSLLLIGTLSITLLALAGFTLGRRRIPWMICILIFIVATFLHIGKNDIRKDYWHITERQMTEYKSIPPWDYLKLFSTWSQYSWQNWKFHKEDDSSASLFERSSLLHLLLMIENKTPSKVPYLKGRTYQTIPQLLVPRIFNPKKLRTHEGTYILSIHYGLQKYEATYRTTIGFGLLNEAYANFGRSGIILIALIIGFFYGWATRWSLHTPLLSFRSLFSILVLSFAYQSEFTAGVYVSALFQSTVILIALSMFLMRTRQTYYVPQHSQSPSHAK